LRVIIIHNRIKSGSDPDEKDVLKQAELVRNGLFRMGIQADVMDIGEDIYLDIRKIQEKKPDLVFNLVESVFDRNELLYLLPALLKAFHIPFTGSSAEALFLTTHKILAKKQMKQWEIPTPDWHEISERIRLKTGSKYILKPIREDGSVNLDEDSVFITENPLLPPNLVKLDPSEFFIEEFIDGREYNISLLTQTSGPEVLPVSEIVFQGYPPGKEKVIGYQAKWNEDSYEYQHTIRKFHIQHKADELITKMHNIALKCWEIFDLKGYARVDFRVDRHDNPLVLEINANPCISHDSGFIAAAMKAGYAPENVVERLISDIN
jgi:D-alanine-D-alanine ligase